VSALIPKFVEHHERGIPCSSVARPVVATKARPPPLGGERRHGCRSGSLVANAFQELPASANTAFVELLRSGRSYRVALPTPAGRDSSSDASRPVRATPPRRLDHSRRNCAPHPGARGPDLPFLHLLSCIIARNVTHPRFCVRLCSERGHIPLSVPSAPSAPPPA